MSNRNIIVVDDDEAIWESYRGILAMFLEDPESPSAQIALLLAEGAKQAPPEQPVFNLTFARQGQEGLATIQQAAAAKQHFAVAFIDIRMPPGWDGMETAARIRKIDPNIEIVIVTAYSDRSRREIVSTVGVPEKLFFLRKPFDPDELYQLALALSEKWNLARRQAKAEAALRQSEERFRSLVETMNDWVWEVDGRGNFLYCAPICQEIYGYSPGELLGQNLAAILLSPAEGERWKKFFDQCVSEVCGFHGHERHCLRKDKSTVYIESSAVPVLNEGGMVIGFRGVDRDVTVRKRQEEERRTLEEQLRHSQKMEAIGTLAGGVAHDLNNVLTPIMGYAEICRMKSGPEGRFTEELSNILLSCGKAANLIRQILTFSRRDRMVTRVLSLNDLIKDLIKMLRRLIRVDIDLAVRVEEAVWPINVDAGKVEQILINLAVNARDAVGRDGRIELSSRNETVAAGTLVDVDRMPISGDFVVLSVQDNGVGMDEATASRIFEPFYTTKEVGRGTGLGLSTVYGIVAQHGGHIRLQTAPGQGSCFQIYFPRSLEKIRLVAEEPIPTFGGGQETILLAEDEPDVRNMLVSILSSYGYQVLAATDGPETVELFSQQGGAVDLLLTDLVMPGYDGREVIARLRQVKPELPAIMMSGYPQDTEALPSQVIFLQKPFKPYVVTNMIRGLLDGTAPTEGGAGDGQRYS